MIPSDKMSVLSLLHLADVVAKTLIKQENPAMS